MPAYRSTFCFLHFFSHLVSQMMSVQLLYSKHTGETATPRREVSFQEKKKKKKKTRDDEEEANAAENLRLQLLLEQESIKKNLRVDTYSASSTSFKHFEVLVRLLAARNRASNIQGQQKLIMKLKQQLFRLQEMR